jgi:putative polymerase
VNFNLEMVLGLASYNTFFFDQGYAILLTRVGVLLMVLLWMAFWMIPMQDVRGERFRTYITIYISLILCVSGTALFALKTAGILWFLMGSYARLEQRKPVISLNSTNYRPTTPKVINDAH